MKADNKHYLNCYYYNWKTYIYYEIIIFKLIKNYNKNK